MEILTKLIIAHAIGDGFLQLLTPLVAKKKARNFTYMLLHCILVAAVFYWVFPYVWVFWAMLSSHLIIDLFTHPAATTPQEAEDWILVLDQIAHGIVLCILWMILT